MKNARPAYEALALLVAMVWGLSFVAQRTAMEEVGPWTFTGLRFALAIPFVGLCALLFEREHIKQKGWRILLIGCMPGIFLTLGSLLQQTGLVTTYASKAGFITALYVCIVPFFSVFIGYRLQLNEVVGAFLAVVGLYCLSIRGGFVMDPGEGLLIISAFVWAGHILSLDYCLRHIKPLSLACVQIGFCAAFSLLGAAFLEPIELPAIIRAGPEIFYSGLLSAGFAFALQVVCQQYVAPSRLGLLISMEAVFAFVGGWFLLGEMPSPRELFGLSLMLLALIVVRLNFHTRELPSKNLG